MKLKLKKEILAFLKDHNDGSEKTAKLIKKMEDECTYADCNAYSVSTDDLDNLDDYHKNILRKKFGKLKDDDWTMEDCEKVAESVSDIIGDDFSENLDLAIEYLRKHS